MYPLTEKSRSDSHGEIATKRRIDVSLIDELDVTPEDPEGRLYALLRDPEEAARARGCLVVYPKDNELQIDCDSEDAFEEFKKRWEEFKAVVTYEVEWSATPSSSGLPHRHITVTAKKSFFSVWERVALQFALGLTL